MEPFVGVSKETSPILVTRTNDNSCSKKNYQSVRNRRREGGREKLQETLLQRFLRYMQTRPGLTHSMFIFLRHDLHILS